MTEEPSRKFCQFCGAPIDPFDQACKSCGRELPDPADRWLFEGDEKLAMEPLGMPTSQWRPKYSTGLVVIDWRLILSQSLKVFNSKGASKRFILIGVLWLLVYAMLAIPKLIYQELFVSTDFLPTTSILPPWISGMFSMASTSMVFSIVDNLLSGIFGAFVIWVAYDIMCAGTARVSSGIKQVMKRILPLIAGILVLQIPALFTILEFFTVFDSVSWIYLFTPLLMLVPIVSLVWLFIDLMLYVYQPVILFEEKGVIESFRGSWILTKRNLAMIFWINLILGLATMMLGLGLSYVTPWMLYYPELNFLLSGAITGFFGVILNIVVAVVYMHLRSVKRTYV